MYTEHISPLPAHHCENTRTFPPAVAGPPFADCIGVSALGHNQSKLIKIVTFQEVDQVLEYIFHFFVDGSTWSTFILYRLGFHSAL